MIRSLTTPHEVVVLGIFFNFVWVFKNDLVEIVATVFREVAIGAHMVKLVTYFLVHQRSPPSLSHYKHVAYKA